MNTPTSDIRRFARQTVLVTGASNGIGAATALRFGREGAFVLVHYHQGEANARALLQQIENAGGEGELLGGDLTTQAGIAALVARIQRPVDILVNNAGSLLERTRTPDFTPELWDQVLTLNLTSAFFISQAVLRGMVERGRGCIVNISSVAARNGGGPGAIAYATAKGALSVMTKALAKEFAPQGIRVNACSPGTIETNFHRQFSTAEMLDKVKAATPAGRLGTSEEVADVICFLCSEDARYIHGQVIEVNGGFLMV